MRLDKALIERGLVTTRTLAQGLILSGDVRKNGQVVTKPSLHVEENDLLETTHTPRYVSRGGLKLEAALETFGIDVADKICLDIGASTGGFTDCLLQNGATKVFAFDSGSKQLAPSLLADARVISRENFNARHLQREDIGEAVELVVIDVSFISLTLILPAAARVLEHGDILALIKPQFEVGRENLGKGGIVREESLRRGAVDKIRTCAAELGLEWRGVIDSPIEGGDGNREFLCWLRKH